MSLCQRRSSSGPQPTRTFPAGRRRGRGLGDGAGDLATVVQFTHQSLRVHGEFYIYYCIQIDKIYTKRQGEHLSCFTILVHMTKTEYDGRWFLTLAS